MSYTSNLGSERKSAIICLTKTNYSLNNQATVQVLNACNMLFDNMVSSDLDSAAYST